MAGVVGQSERAAPLQGRVDPVHEPVVVQEWRELHDPRGDRTLHPVHPHDGGDQVRRGGQAADGASAAPGDDHEWV